MKKTIVILANSIKHSQHCVAGKDIVTKDWIRLVSNANGSELTDEQTLYRNPYGKFPIKVMQKVEIEFLQAAPLINQPENYIIMDAIWLQRYNLGRYELDSYLDNPDILWSNISSSIQGENDKVSYEHIEKGHVVITQSLYLIKVNNAKVIVITNIMNNKRIRLSFAYKGINYNLAVTDPSMRENFLYRDIGEYQLNEIKYLCISLAEPFTDGFCYKLAAAIL